MQDMNPPMPERRGVRVQVINVPEAERLGAAQRVRRFAGEYRRLLLNPQLRGKEFASLFRVSGNCDEVLKYLIANCRPNHPDIALLNAMMALRCGLCRIDKRLDDHLDQRLGEPQDVLPTSCTVQECQRFLCRACSLARCRTFAVVDVEPLEPVEDVGDRDRRARERRLPGIPGVAEIPVWYCLFHSPPQ